MVDVRKKAHSFLDTIPDEVKSKGTDDEEKLFIKLTGGKTHAALQAEWESTKKTTGVLRTVCIDFVVWYSQQMEVNLYKTIDPKVLNLNVDGFFNLEATLKKAGKSHAWVPSTSQKLPQFGDILRHTVWHVDISLGMDKGILERVAGGQSSHPRPTEDVSKEYDNIKRIRGKKEYDPKDLQGWLDLDLFFFTRPGSNSTLGHRLVEGQMEKRNLLLLSRGGRIGSLDEDSAATGSSTPTLSLSAKPRQLYFQ